MPGLLLEMDPSVVPDTKAPEYGFVVSHQKVELEIDFSTQTLSGRCEITILPQTKDIKTISIDARQCDIRSGGVTVGGKLADFDFEDPMENMELPRRVAWGVEQHKLQSDRIQPLIEDVKVLGALIIEIPRTVNVEEVDPFSESAATAVTQRALGASAIRQTSMSADVGPAPLSAAPTLTPKTAAEQAARFQPLIIGISFETKKWRDGLQWIGLGENDARYPHAYTRHSIDPGIASCVFPCVDDPAMRCTWEISIKCSRTLGDAMRRKPGQKVHSLQHLLQKRGLTNGLSNGSNEENEVQLSPEEKLLDMTVVCSGELMNESTDLDDSSKKVVSFLVSTIVAPQHIGFAIGPFEQVDLSEYREVEDDEKLGQGQTLPVVGFCLPGRADEVRHTCTPMAHALDYFLLNFGSYPFTECKMVFVDDQLRDTEHTASLSICSSRLLFGEDIIDPELDNIRTLVHAIASQWIGVSIVPNQRCDRWVTIGLSHFMTGLFMKSLCGHNEYAFRQKVLTDRLVEEDFQRPGIHALGEHLHLGQFEVDFMSLKAPLVMFILDRRIIKASGSAGLTRVLSRLVVTANTGTAADSVMSTDGFRRSCEKITKYRQTESFWSQWVYGSGCPRFTIAQKFNKKRLCVEMVISQKQDKLLNGTRRLEQSSFLRDFTEDVHHVYAGDLQPVFTGPMTIRIHEADGTPYEHIVEIREGHAKIEIPYKTKYKRLKRSRRQKERQNAGAIDFTDNTGEDALYYCLGDVLTSPNDIKEWGLSEWSVEQEQKMEQESYEWIRVDADFEWLCDKHFIQMESYMYVSQLQQDRDVVAQHEAMLFLGSCGPHPLVATFLIRTLMDPRYFHAIRVMAADYLKRHADKSINMIGLRLLENAYQELFCYPGQKMPRTNDFSDKRAYQVEKAIAASLSQIRVTDGDSNKTVCPKEARQALLDMLRFNDNTNNEFSDNYKITNLLSALADSLIPGEDKINALNQQKRSQEGNGLVNGVNGVHHEPDSLTNDDDILPMDLAVEPVVDTEPAEFQKTVIDELDRYRRMDEWINSYHNSFTITVLRCKSRLMKAKIIPMEPVEFAQYLHDETSDHIRIEAYKALVDLGYLRNEGVMTLLLDTLSTDPSPFTRNHLYGVLYHGLATVAFGDTKLATLSLAAPKPITASDVNAQGSGDMSADGAAPLDNDGLIVEEDVSLEARKAAVERISSIEGAVAALKEELHADAVFKDVLWRAVGSNTLTALEQGNLLDLCGQLYDFKKSMILQLKVPRYWKAKHLGKGVLLFKATNKLRTRALKPYVKTPSPSPIPTANVPPPSAPLPPAPAVRLSISTASSKSAISIKNPPTETVIPVKKPASTTITLKPSTTMKPPSFKRPFERTQSFDVERPRKILKLRSDPAKVAEILARPPRPAPISVKSRTKSTSPVPGYSPSPTMSGTPAHASPSPAFQTIVASPSPSAGRKPLPEGSRKPLPEGRKPLPDLPAVSLNGTSSSASPNAISGRKPLPDLPATASSGRKPLPGTPAPVTAFTAASASPAPTPMVLPTPEPPKRFLIKLKTNSGFSPSPTPQ